MEYHSHDDDFVYLKGTTTEAVKIGGSYVKSKNAFRVPISFASLKDLYDATMSKEVEQLWYDEAKKVEQTLALKNLEDAPNSEALRPYQRVDVEVLKTLGSFAVFNEQRTGKTPTILTAIKNKLGKGIVVCPSSLKLNWKMEYERWVGKTDGEVVSGSKKKRLELYEKFTNTKLSMLFISYETLRADILHLVEVLPELDVLIIDEAHRLRNFNSLQSKALYRLRNKVKYVYPMTGTPAVNHSSDVYGILKMIEPKKYPSYWQFIERYFGYVEGRFGRELLEVRKDREDELAIILQMISLQRKRRDVMKWIPKVDNRKLFIDLDNSQYRHLKKIKEEFMYGENIIPNVIAQLTRLRQVSLDPGLLDLTGKSAKTEFIKEFVEDNDGKIIVFSSFTSYLKRLAQVIPNNVLLTGEMTDEQKAASVYSVQHGDTKVLLSNIQVGGTGWTLDNVDTIIFTDKSYNPIDNEQAADRFIPTDPNKTYGAKQIITLIGKNTIEHKIDLLLDQKINIIQFVNDYGYDALVNYEEGENNNNASISNKR